MQSVKTDIFKNNREHSECQDANHACEKYVHSGMDCNSLILLCHLPATIEFYIAARTLPIVTATLTYTNDVTCPVSRLCWSVIQILSPTKTTNRYYIYTSNKELIWTGRIIFCLMKHLCIVCQVSSWEQSMTIAHRGTSLHFRATGNKHMLKLKQDLVKVLTKYIYYLSSFNFINHSLFYSTIFQFLLQSAVTY